MILCDTQFFTDFTTTVIGTKSIVITQTVTAADLSFVGKGGVMSFMPNSRHDEGYPIFQNAALHDFALCM